MATRSVLNLFSELSKINCRHQVLVFGNPGEPQAVEWALARSKQHLVQASDPHERNRQPQSDAGEFGFMRVTADVFAKPKI